MRIWIAICLVLCVACGQQGTEGKKVLRVAVQAPPISMDPRQGGNASSQAVTRMMYEGLFRSGSDGEPLPALAESYEVSDDGLTYTFHLRKSSWSNGAPLTADDFVYSWRQAVSPDFDTLFAYCFYLIKGAEPAKLGEASPEEIGVRALDDRTLEVTLVHPAPYFIDHLANTILSPIHADTARENPEWAYRADTIVTSGPFELSRWQPDSLIVLDRFEGYWDRDNVRLDGLEYNIVGDGLTAYALFEKSKLDVVGDPLIGMPLETRTQLHESGELQSIPGMGAFQYVLNCSKEPFTNPALRRAFAHAIDRQEIVDNVSKVGEQVMTSILPPQLTLSKGDLIHDGDVAFARELFEQGLQETGLTRDTFPKVVITYGTLEGHKAYAQTVQQQWTQAFDIPIQVVAVEWSAFFQTLGAGDFQVISFPWRSWYNDPMYNFEYVKYAGRNMNNSAWEHPAFVALLDLADGELDPQVRAEYLREAEKLVMHEMPLVPVHQLDYHFVTQPGVEGIYISPKGLIDLKYVDLMTNS
jgi:oligopeptide transport system substrate-binding protein